MSRHFAATALLASVVALFGCGGDAGLTLSGSVTYNGEPVESGFITFSPTGSGTSIGAEIIDGKYKAEKAHVGEFQVLVRATSSVQAAPTREEAAKQAADGPTQSPDYIPENAQGNGQTVEIKAGEQTLDFALTGPPRQ